MKAFSRYITFAFVGVLMIITGCEESPFLTREEAEKIVNETINERNPFHDIKHVVAIINNDVYYFDDLVSEPRRLTQTPSDKKTDVKLSHDHSRVAYLNKNNVPVIINTTDGGVVATLSDYAYPIQMDWADDRLSLYVLIGREVFVYGEVFTAPQPDEYHSSELYSYSTNSNGDYAYYEYSFYGKKLYFNSPKNNISTAETSYFEGNFYDYIDFYDNKGGYLLAAKSPGGFSKIVCVNDYASFSSYRWQPSYDMTSPRFNNDREVLVYGTSYSSAPHYIQFVYLGTAAYASEGTSEILNMRMYDYPSNTRIYVDWVE